MAGGQQLLRLMADIRIGVRVSLRGRALKVVDSTAISVEARRVLLEDEVTGEQFVVTTRVLRRQLPGSMRQHGA